MPALVTGNGNTLYIFFNGTFYNFCYTPIVTEMDDFGSLALQNPAHDIDGSIMTIKQSCSGNNPYFLVG